MARKTKKQKAQEFVDEASRLYNEAKDAQERTAWAKNTLPKSEEAIKLDPSNARTWSWRGVAKANLGHHKDAIGDYSKAIELEPENAILWCNRGLAKSELDDSQGAIDDYSKAIKFDPKYVIAWNNRGWAKFRLRKYSDAIKDYDKVLKIESHNEVAQNNRQLAVAAEEEEKTRKKAKEYHERLTTKSDKFDKYFKRNIKHRRWLFIGVVGIIIVYVVALILMIVCSYIVLSGPFDLLPYLALLFAILSPFIWLIRINIREAERNLTLREDYYGRYTVELYLQRFFVSTDRQEFAQKYMTYWMYNNPSETLIRLANKSAEKPELPQFEQINNVAKNVQPPPTDPKP